MFGFLIYGFTATNSGANVVLICAVSAGVAAVRSMRCTAFVVPVPLDFTPTNAVLPSLVTPADVTMPVVAVVPVSSGTETGACVAKLYRLTFPVAIVPPEAASAKFPVGDSVSCVAAGPENAAVVAELNVTVTGQTDGFEAV